MVGRSDCSSGVCAFTPLSSQATARPDVRHLVRKPGRESDRQTVREPCRQDLSTVRTSRTVVVDTQSDGSGAWLRAAARPRTSVQNIGQPTTSVAGSAQDSHLVPSSETGTDAVEHVVDAVGDVHVVERNGVGVMAQRRRRIAVTETRLCLQEMPGSDDLGADAVTEPVQRRIR